MGGLAQGLPGSTNAQTLLVRYADAAVAKDWVLAWSVLPILEADCAPPHLAWPALGLRSPPLLDVVLRHLRSLAGDDGGESLLAAWPPQTLDPLQACMEVLKHISSQVRH